MNLEAALMPLKVIAQLLTFAKTANFFWFLWCFVSVRNEHTRVWEREMHCLCRCICVCFLLLHSSSCLYSTVPTSCDSVFHLFDIKWYYSLHLSAAACICLYFCLSVSPSNCFLFSCVQGVVDWLVWCVGAQTDYTEETDSSTCVCVRGCVRGHVGVCVVSVSSEQSGFNDFGTHSSL